MKSQTSLPVPAISTKPSDIQTEFQNLLSVRTRLPQLIESSKLMGEQLMGEEITKFSRTLGVELADMKTPLDKSTADRVVDRVKTLESLEQQGKDRLKALEKVWGVTEKRIKVLRETYPEDILKILEARFEQLKRVRETQNELTGQLDEEIKKVDKELAEVKKRLENLAVTKSQTEAEAEASPEVSSKRKPS